MSHTFSLLLLIAVCVFAVPKSNKVKNKDACDNCKLPAFDTDGAKGILSPFAKNKEGNCAASYNCSASTLPSRIVVTRKSDKAMAVLVDLQSNATNFEIFLCKNADGEIMRPHSFVISEVQCEVGETPPLEDGLEQSKNATLLA